MTTFVMLQLVIQLNRGHILTVHVSLTFCLTSRIDNNEINLDWKQDHYISY